MRAVSIIALGLLLAGTANAQTSGASPPPGWGESEIRESRTVHLLTSVLPAERVHDADPMNLFVVIEDGGKQVTILDGDRFEPLARLPRRFPPQGTPEFSPDGRFVYFASREGWIAKYDLHGLALVAEVRAGIDSTDLAISGDGRVLAVANHLPRTLVLLDAAELSLLKVIEIRDMHAKKTSRVSAVYLAAPRQSFVVALGDVPEIWEIPYGENPPTIFSGLVHSHEEGKEEGLAAKQRFPIRRIELKQPLDDFFFTPDHRRLIGATPDGRQGVVVHLDVRREIARLALPGLPHFGASISWLRRGHRMMAVPHLKAGAVSIVDMTDWRLEKRIETPGPGAFIASHANTPYIWSGALSGPDRDTIYVIDKKTLEIEATLRPAPGKAAAHVAFTRDGRHALVSVRDKDGAIVVYDVGTLAEVKRIPFVEPSRMYNVQNRIHRSDGTSD